MIILCIHKEDDMKKAVMFVVRLIVIGFAVYLWIVGGKMMGEGKQLIKQGDEMIAQGPLPHIKTLP